MNPTQPVCLQVEDGDVAQRIDKYIADHLAEISRSRVQALIDQGHVWLNGKTCPRVNEKVSPGDQIQLQLPPPEPSELTPESLPITFLYEDEHLAVVNKPPGMTVHPAGGHRNGTLVNALLHHLTDLSGIGGELRPGIVHRLDRVTSGIMIVAKHDEAHQRLSALFKSRAIKKCYWALVHGQPAKEEWLADWPISRHPNDRKRFCVDQRGRPCQTRFTVRVASLAGSWLEVYPITGRTHQIRVHLSHAGFPIVGDRLYLPKNQIGRGRFERELAAYPGIGLHARSLRLIHPFLEQEMAFEAEPFEPLASILRKML